MNGTIKITDWKQEIAKEKAESEFEMYRVIQDRTFKSDFDLFSEENEKLEKK